MHTYIYRLSLRSVLLCLSRLSLSLGEGDLLLLRSLLSLLSPDLSLLSSERSFPSSTSPQFLLREEEPLFFSFERKSSKLDIKFAEGPRGGCGGFAFVFGGGGTA